MAGVDSTGMDAAETRPVEIRSAGADPAASRSPEDALAGWARATRPSALQTMLSLASRPGTLSFALGLPAPELFPRADIAAAAASVLEGDPLSLQYTPPLARLREQIAEVMERRGAPCSPRQVFLTAGAQQGMSLLARILLEPGGAAVTERLTYTGFRQVLEPFQPRVAEVGTDPDDGMDVDALARVLERGPRPSLIYAIPRGHNPLSVGMSREKGERLVALAARHGVPVVEDDAYGFLQYGDRLAPPLRALSPEWVCYVGSFSKILAPGLRQGWVVVPEAFVPRLAIVKESSDIDTATLAQRTLSAYLATGKLEAHVAGLVSEYRRRRDTMLRALEAHLPEGTRWRAPDAGLFVWVELPPDAHAGTVLRLAVEDEGVAFLPGTAFAGGDEETGRSVSHCMRLNFSHSTPDVIEEGVRRLGRAVARARASA